MEPKKYEPKDFSHLRGLTSVNDATLETHFELYRGYVNRSNALVEKLRQIHESTGASGKDPVYAELTRRMGFEFNGMVLHELYFGNLAPKGKALGQGSPLHKLFEKSFGSYERWLEDFKAVGTMPGIGWAVTYYDPRTGHLTNHWVTLHETNNVAGFAPVVVMDAWEHAYVPTYKATERAKYVDALVGEIDWTAVDKRIEALHKR